MGFKLADAVAVLLGVIIGLALGEPPRASDQELPPGPGMFTSAIQRATLFEWAELAHHGSDDYPYMECSGPICKPLRGCHLRGHLVCYGPKDFSPRTQRAVTHHTPYGKQVVVHKLGEQP